MPEMLFFSMLMLTVSLGGKERKLHGSVLLVGANWCGLAKKAWEFAGWWKRGELVSSADKLFLSVTFCNNSPAIIQVGAFTFLSADVASACWPCVFCRSWGHADQGEIAAGHLGCLHENLEGGGSGCLLVALTFVISWMDVCFCRGANCGHASIAAALCRQLVPFLVILCRKGVLRVLWLFSLDHLSAAVFNELEKK